MANADFSQKQNSTPGGFDAGSYREQKQPEQAVPLTPLQQKLAGAEAKLPPALSTRAAALALSVVVMLAAFLGFGSANPCSENPYDGTVCPTYQGTVMAVFRGSGHARFTAEGLPPLELDF